VPAPGDAGIIRGTAVRPEQLGYDSVWVSDHVVEPHATNLEGASRQRRGERNGEDLRADHGA
jgi:alkanesulfonate monooxygenase SsuD/methylene tetrahydromethanopterin reductase-like flavin-dependent oxidoreductase (luciferase family)